MVPPIYLGGRSLLAGVSRETGGPGTKGWELCGISNRYLCSANFPKQSGDEGNNQKQERSAEEGKKQNTVSR